MAKKKDDMQDKKARENMKTASNAVQTEKAEAEPVEEKAPETAIPDTVTLTRDEFLQVKAKLDALEKEKADNIAFTQRLQADFDNYRKRNATISADCLEEGGRNVIKALLPVIDDMERAIAAIPEEGESWANGVKLVKNKLMGILEKLGLEEIASEGQFDPELHNAVLQEENDQAESGQITEVLQKGYKVKNRIIRHTMVKVAK